MSSIFQRACELETYSRCISGSIAVAALLASSSQLMNALPPWLAVGSGAKPESPLWKIFMRFCRAMEFSQELFIGNYIKDQPEQTASQLAELCRKLPNLQRLSLDHATNEHVVSIKGLRFLRKLVLSNSRAVTEEDLGIMSAQHLPSLEDLELEYLDSVKQSSALVEVLPRLKRLVIHRMPIPFNDDLAASFARCAASDKLRELKLQLFRISDGITLRGISNFKFLEQLTVDTNHTTDEDMMAILAATLCLRSLAVTVCDSHPLTDRCLALLPSALLELKCHTNIPLSDSALQLMGQRCPLLEAFSFNVHHVHPSTVADLQNLFPRRGDGGAASSRLKQFHLHVPSLQPVAWNHLDALGCCRDLRKLDLRDVQIEDAEFALWMSSLPLLEELSVEYSSVDQRHLSEECIAEHLVKAKYLKRVYIPSLNMLTIKALGHAKLEHLEYINLSKVVRCSV